MVTRRIPDPKIGGSIPSGVIFEILIFWKKKSAKNKNQRFGNQKVKKSLFEACTYFLKQISRYGQVARQPLRKR